MNFSVPLFNKQTAVKGAHAQTHPTTLSHTWHLQKSTEEGKYTILFKWGEAQACLFVTNCVGIDVVLLCVLSHTQHMHYAFIVLSGFLPV